MAKGGQTTTQQTGLDPESQSYVNQMRQQALQGAQGLQGGGPLFLGADPRSIQEQMQPFMNPYMNQVIGGVQGEFDNLRGQARLATNDAATRAGAFGGSRHGVAEGVRMGELDRAQTSQIGGLLSQGYQNALGQGLQHSEYQRALQERQMQEPLFRAQQQMQMLNMGMGPTGSTSTTEQPGPSFWGQLLGAGLTGAGLFMGGPAGGAAGSALSGGGGFQPGSLFQDAPLPGQYRYGSY
jgi:hypothetical protein